MKKKYLAMDFGASTGRGILGSFDGEKLVMDEVHRFSNYFVPVNGKFYWGIFRLYHETENSVQKAVLQGNKMVSVGVDTWGTDYGLLGTDGQLLGNCRCMRNADSTYQDLVEQEGKHYDLCVAIGPMIMMKFVCKTTEALNIPTIVSLNPIMVDGTGMCGACRVTVGGEVKFACVDGPEFDGHLVNFDEAMQRQQIYKTQEGRAYLAAKEKDTHHGGCGQCGGEE